MSSQVKEIPLEKLTVDQLNMVGKQIEGDINHYSQYYSSLKLIENRFKDNKEYINELKEFKDKEILVPITSSLYIPGKCKDVKKLMIEIGANFFVETSVEKADGFCDRKLASLKENMEKVDKIIQDKNNQLNAINQNLIEKEIKAKKAQ